MRKAVIGIVFNVLAVFLPLVSYSQALPSERVNHVIQSAMNENYYFKDSDFQRKNNTFIRMSESSSRAAANSPSFIRTVTSGVSWAGSLRSLVRRTPQSFIVSLAIESGVRWAFSDEAAEMTDADILLPGLENSTYEVIPDSLPEFPVVELPELENPDFRFKTPGLDIVVKGKLTAGYRDFYNVPTINGYVLTLSPITAADLLKQNFYDVGARSKANGQTWVNGSILEEYECYFDVSGNYVCPALITMIQTHDPYGNEINKPYYYLSDFWASFLSLRNTNPQQRDTSPVTCPGGYMFVGPNVVWTANSTNRNQFILNGECMPDPSPVDGGDEIVHLGEATNSLTEFELTKRLNPRIISELTDLLWRDASMQPDYDGVPYPGWNTFDQWELQQWLNQNPDLWPSVNDFVQPLPEPSVAPEYWQVPKIPPETPPVLDLGPDPGIPQPRLETVPTAAMIVNPLINLFPDLKTYEIDMSSGECPRPNFDAFGMTYSVYFHCDLFEQNRSLFSAVMLATFSLSSLFIVLRA
ncbi:hypothetical protein AB6N01_01185 [Alcaligenes nematophilus]|uniref:hypothetical protein n=1 Tax=Alcaligenes nematophilus TaxID=2994643 RepID=UPI0034E06ABF